MRNTLFVASLVAAAAAAFTQYGPSPATGPYLRDAPRSAAADLGLEAAAAVPAPSPPVNGRKALLHRWVDETPAVKGPSEAQKSRMAAHNKRLKGLLKGDPESPPVYRPYADYEPAGYLIMNAKFNFRSVDAKMAAARTLGPGGVLVLLFANYEISRKDELIEAYSAVVPKERIKAVAVYDANDAFWARDAMPVPVLHRETGEFAVVDAKYYNNFDSDDKIAGLFGAKVLKHNYYFEGGNFMANHRGDCLMVNKDPHSSITDADFAAYYGCSRLIRLPHLYGIGHVDEHARFVDADTVLTDLEEYRTTLEAAGFKVKMLPRVPNSTYSSHVNSLLIEGKVALPAYGKGTDEQARAVYESLGLTVFPADSNHLSEAGEGSIHCITMTYPRVPFKEVLKSLKAREL
jgi:agmatine/peptidylarginine deiminase